LLLTERFCAGLCPSLLVSNFPQWLYILSDGYAPEQAINEDKRALQVCFVVFFQLKQNYRIRLTIALNRNSSHQYQHEADTLDIILTYIFPKLVRLRRGRY
jgi:hypothetical protein